MRVVEKNIAAKRRHDARRRHLLDLGQAIGRGIGLRSPRAEPDVRLATRQNRTKHVGFGTTVTRGDTSVHARFDAPMPEQFDDARVLRQAISADAGGEGGVDGTPPRSRYR